MEDSTEQQEVAKEVGYPRVLLFDVVIYVPCNLVIDDYSVCYLSPE
jgi:hypothetical protein